MRALQLPDFPWDSLAADKAIAAGHPGGIVDLSVGTPVDPVPAVVRDALAGPAADVPGYPTTHGTPELREAVAGSLARRFHVAVDPRDVLPTIGSKELVAWLPTLLGITAGDLVVIPEIAYPTYEVGALLAGAEFAAHGRADARWGPGAPALIWLNSPSNPTGRVLPVEHLRKVVTWARERGAIVASDECYLALLRAAAPGHVDPAPRRLRRRPHRPARGALDEQVVEPRGVPRRVRDRRPRGRRGAARDPQARRDDGAPPRAGRDGGRGVRRRARRRPGGGLRPAPRPAAGWRWRRGGSRSSTPRPGCTCGRRRTSRARDGPPARGAGHPRGAGEFYGPAGERHVRVAVTATDERIAAAIERLAA